MRILVLGDVMGRTGRRAITERLPELRARLEADFVIVNCENATQGRGVTYPHAKTLINAGIDCVTLGDHAFDQDNMKQGVEVEPRILRPLNIAKGARGRKVLVMSALGRVFMNRPFNDPFEMVGNYLDMYRIGATVSAVVLDFHAEATSEKLAMGHWCDGRVSLVAGTHTHVPTADARILNSGTAYISDVGMCGDYDSVIGVQKDEPIKRCVTGMRGGKFTPASGEATLSGVLVDTDDATGLATAIDPIFVGGLMGK